MSDDYYTSLGNVDEMTSDILKYMNMNYTFGSSNGDFNPYMWLSAFNKSLLEREGLPNPYELYLEGEWDWDAWEKIQV